MKPRANCIATKALLLLALWLFCMAARAAPVAPVAPVADSVATVVNLSGALLAKKADGTVKILALKSAVQEGDTLISEKDTYARIRFIDNSEMTLKPNSQLKIEGFAFDEGKPENDRAAFSLLKGGLRAVTGALGKRNHDRFGMNTPTATIGIRGTTFIAEFVAPPETTTVNYGFASAAAAEPVLSDSPRSAVPIGMLPAKDGAPMRLAQVAGMGAEGRAPGLYVQVLDGIIMVSNSGGALGFAAGQFGYTPSVNQPPVVLPTNPGMLFTPPPAFNTVTGPQAGQNGNANSGNVDCEVR